uniref:DUF4408 domain-containing protein n=1 Tax=Parastrongyloides trichosuri TaxID=131310 RepID=A0A0N4ZY56_PARTI
MEIILFLIINFVAGLVSTIIILHAHRRFCYKFYHTHTQKCVPNQQSTITPSRRGVDKVERELSKNVKKVDKQLNVNKARVIAPPTTLPAPTDKSKREEDTKTKTERTNTDVTKGGGKKIETNMADPTYIDLTSIEENLKKAKK